MGEGDEIRDLISLVVHKGLCLGKTLDAPACASVVLPNDYMGLWGLKPSNQAD
jgi:hypothetical protein